MRYIDADKLIKALYIQSDDDGFICCGAEDLDALIQAQPTADVGEVVRGEWITDGCIEKCNRCGEQKEFPHWSYCPNCGADMIGERFN